MRALIGAAAVVLALSTSAGAEDYRAEAEKIADEIITIHPRGKEIAGEADYIAAKESLLAMAGDADLAHYALALGRLLHTADDGHTALLSFYSEDPIFAWRFPLRLMRFEDGLYVVAAKDEAAPLLGGRVERVGGRKVDEILRNYVPTGPSGNRAWPANWAGKAISCPAWLMGFDLMSEISSPVEFTVTRNGRKVSAKLTARAGGQENLTDIEHKKSALAQASGGAANYVTTVGGALVLVVGAMEDSEKKSFEAFTEEAAKALKETKAERLIVDLRDNGGGNNMLAEPLRRTIIKSRFNHVGGMYVLAAPQTFSAAQNFATRLERETDALFVGEPTGGSPNHFGDAKFDHGAVSKLPYLVSTLRWQDSTPFDKREWILPDLPASPKFSDYIAGKDGALEIALAHSAGAAPDTDWRGRVVQPWSRDSQKGSWRFFYEANQ